MPRAPRPRFSKSRRRWYANIGEPDANGRATEVFAPESISERDEPAAWEWFRVEKQRRESRAVDPAGLTVEWVCEHYLAWSEVRRDEGRVSPEHFTNKTIHLGHFAAFFRGRVLATLDVAEMDAFVGAMRKAYQPHYVANICSSVSAAVNWAVRSRHLASSPIAGFSVPPVPRSPERFAERKEAADWLRYCWRRCDPATVAGRYGRLTTLMQRLLIHSGARPGEACVLLWSDIKWGGWTTLKGLPAAKATIPADRWKAGAKTGRARTIYVSPALTRALRREHGRPGRHPTHVFVHGPGRGGRGAGGPWESGSRLSKTVLRIRREAIAASEAQRARAKSGEPLTRAEELLAGMRIEDVGPNRLTNYRWRHTAASEMLMLGLDPTTVAELLGTSVDMLVRHYGHLLDRHLAEAASKFGSRRSPGP